MLRSVLVAAALLFAFPAAGTAGPQPLFELGRMGGNIEPFTVAIQSDGTLEHTGDVRLAQPGKQLSTARLAALMQLARTQRFWALPHRTLCPGALPDVASLYVTIHTGTTRTVIVRGGCRPRFARMYRALAAAATVTS